MIFEKTRLDGVWLIRPEPHQDERGFFARYFCEKEFRAQGLVERFVQMNGSGNLRKGTLRGLHYQAAPGTEAKVVRCTLGRVFDVVVDLRPTSPTFKQWTSFELSRENRLAVYIPPGLAHGYQTLVDDCEVLYQMSAFYEPALDRGLRWDDPAFQITWPLPSPLLSDRDRDLPLFQA